MGTYFENRLIRDYCTDEYEQYLQVMLKKEFDVALNS